MNTFATTLLSMTCLLSACSEGQGSEKLAGALHAAIPVFEPSDLESREPFAFDSGEDFSSLESYEAILWELSSPRPYDEVVAYYRSVVPPLPEDEDEIDYGYEDEESDALFQMYPEGPDGDIEIEITVHREPVDGRTRFSIAEIVPEARR